MPDKKWIYENCAVSKIAESYMEKLPGKYTLILPIKNKNKISKESLVGTLNSLGVRIPENWFAEFLSVNNLVFVTTSVNLSGEKPISKIKEINSEMIKEIDYVIDDGVLEGKPSEIINLTGEKEDFLRRNN